ncbi:MAG: hypothetical protein H6Q73_2535 [Firmicutes bacterium]|nr:hypothetical protein [Bacillota bacterium]
MNLSAGGVEKVLINCAGLPGRELLNVLNAATSAQAKLYQVCTVLVQVAVHLIAVPARELNVVAVNKSDTCNYLLS